MSKESGSELLYVVGVCLVGWGVAVRAESSDKKTKIVPRSKIWKSESRYASGTTLTLRALTCLRLAMLHHVTLRRLHVNHVCRTNAIITRNYHDKRFLKIQGLDVCRVSISPKHTVPHSASIILGDSSHVLRPVVHERYRAIIERRYDPIKEGLWLMTTGNYLSKKKKVVRSWAKRRMAQAVAQELRMRGFDEQGRAIGIDGGTRNDKGCSKALVGSVDIHVFEKSIDAGFTELRTQAGLLVEKILEICGRQVRRTQ